MPAAPSPRIAQCAVPDLDHPARSLERALLLSFIAHGLAMAAMATLLLPGLPGGGVDDTAARMAYVAEHPWRWRLGWLPWQLTALADLLIAIALVRTAWIPRRPAALTIAVTIVTIVLDLLGQGLWVTRGVALARTADLAAYAPFEAVAFAWVGAWVALLYAAVALGWTWCFAAAGVWRRGLTALSAFLWPLFGLLSVAPLMPAGASPPAPLVAAGNAVAFILLLAWLVAVTELVLRRSRPNAAHGRYAPWRHSDRRLGRFLDPLANSRFLRALCEYLPVVAFLSDIADVIYVNYVVEARRLEPLVPPGLELQRLGSAGRHAFFTFLSYRHGDFGPGLLGPLRRLLPSPVQTNWRIHVQDPRTGLRGVYFVTTAISSTPHALAARLLSEGIPMHALRRGEVRHAGAGAFHLCLDPGAGTAPDAEAVLRLRDVPPADGPWRACFDSYAAMLAYCVPQDRAFSSQPWHGWVTRQEIALGIPLGDCQPLEGEVRSRAATAIVGDATPFCFRVPTVRFRFAREEHDRLA